MPFVLDASIAACWAFEDENHPAAALALERIRTDEALVPGIWWFEVRSTLIVNERHGRLFAGRYRHFSARALAARGDAVLALARTHRLSVYDASYLELAQRERLLLATLDHDLRKAARAAGTALLGEP